MSGDHAADTHSAHLVLADGTVFAGRPFGADVVAVGEAVFTTGMTGYEEVLTDPSYAGQLVTMTAPEIGNVGVNVEDSESLDDKPRVAGLIVRQASPIASSWRAKSTLHEWLSRSGIAGIEGIDTRKLTRHLRDHGAQNAAFGAAPVEDLLARARAAPDMNGLDLVGQVAPREPYAFRQGRGYWHPDADAMLRASRVTAHRRRVVAIDYGTKKNILRCLVDAGCEVTCVPPTYSAKQILDLDPDGVFLSNGPGDPAALPQAIGTVRDLLGKKPLFGICLGHQLLALALGGKTYKLKFGHRGTNQPVKDLSTGRIEITTQNHGFCVDLATLPREVSATHVHLNDGSSEGIAVPELSASSVQYHPEAAAGPHDSLHLFDRFVSTMRIS